ncbi:MAG TPA: heavy metal-binding domain-containing protein [Streptosporangiaceae bacterium]
MAEIKASGTWSSALTTDEFAAIRSTGFEPVGQVLGAAVYNIGYRGGYGCPSYFGFGSYNRMAGYQGYRQATTAVSSSGSGTAYAPLVQTLYAARRSAIARMTAECAQLGGHGIVGVRLTIGTFPAGGLEFKAIGTAVRAPGARPLSRPFTSDLSGQDFAKLIADGAVPVSLVLGISIGARHDDWLTRNQASRWMSGNTEVAGYTDLVNHTRHDARDQLSRDVRNHGAEGVVIQSMDMRIGEHECPAQEGARDHVAEVTIIGTAITHFTRSRRAAERPSLAILSLDPERRQAVRGRRLAQ